MTRSEAQKAADKRYREAHKDDLKKWATWFKPEEVKEIDGVIKSSGMSKAEFIRQAVEAYKQGKF